MLSSLYQEEVLTKSLGQCKEIEENNTMGKTKDLFKKIGDIKGTFHARLDTVSLGQEDPLEKEMATHSSILAWRTPQRV